MSPLRIVRILAALLSLAPPLSAQAQAAAPAPEVTLLPGDAIRLTVWRQEDMTGEFLVDEEGVATLPLLGPRKVTGISLVELRRSLYEEFQRELRNPSIEITPLRQVYVLGEVKAPGLYRVDPTISLAGAIALAGGATANGNPRAARIVRSGSIVLGSVPSEASLTAVDVRSGDQIFVGERAFLARNYQFFLNLIVSASFFAASVLVR